MGSKKHKHGPIPRADSVKHLQLQQKWIDHLGWTGLSTAKISLSSGQIDTFVGSYYKLNEGFDLHISITLSPPGDNHNPRSFHSSLRVLYLWKSLLAENWDVGRGLFWWEEFLTHRGAFISASMSHWNQTYLSRARARQDSSPRCHLFSPKLCHR